MGLGIGDYNNDGWLDLAFSNVGANSLLHNNGDGTYSDVSGAAGIERDTVAGGESSITWGTCFFDHDNDGWLDLLYVAGYIGGVVIPEPDAFFRNNGDGTFTDISDASGLNDPARGRNASMADFDGDGFVDVFIGNFGEEFLLYHNLSADQGNVNNWLTLTLEGTISNRDAIGARVTATLVDGTVLTREITSGPTHGGGDHRAAYLGLGSNGSAHVVVRWPSGLTEDFGDIAADQKVHLVENSTAPTLYSNVTATVGIDPTHLLDPTCGMPPIGSGSAWADYDNDGDVDLYVTQHGGPNHLWRNEGDTNGDELPDFVDVAEVAGVDLPNEVSGGCVFADYDNDGDQDLYVLNWGGNTLYQNVLVEIGVAAFVDVTSFAGVGDDDRAITAAWGDYNQDGYLDLYITKHFDCMPDFEDSDDHLYKNNGDGTFTDVSSILCGGTYPCDAVGGHGFSPGFFDYDNDGDLDIYVVNDIVGAGWGNVLFRNDGADSTGTWVFTDVSVESGTNYSVNGMGLGIGDYNNDGWMDLAFSHTSGGFMLRNEGDGTFFDVTDSAGVRADQTPGGANRITWGTVLFDHDNDGWQDLFYVAGRIGDEAIPEPNAFFRNNQDGTFTDWSDTTGLNDPGRGRSASIADFDQDGYVDLFVGNFGQPAILYRNDSEERGNTNHWLTVTAQGTESNRDGIGSRLTLTTPDGLVQTRDITSGPTHGGGDQKVAHFGMGPNTTGELSIRWPNGTVEDIGTVSADQFLLVIEGGLTSVQSGAGIAEQYRLFQNYPNPFNPTTTIRYSLRDEVRVTLKVFNLLGQEVATLVDDVQTPGNKEVVWNGRSQSGSPVASGMYIYRLKAGNFVESQKMILSK
jgi:hypothetical protein